MLSDTRGCLSQPVFSPFQEVAEEFLLQGLAVAAVEMREVRVAVHFKPFLLGAGAQPAFEIAARVQAHAAPVAGGEQRRLDVLELRDALS